MILHSVRASQWRSLLNPAEAGPFSEGLNVIHAPNGSGKSSLFEAMRRALFDAHLVMGKEIEAVRPWGRALAPQVTVEFSQAGVRYRIEKTFLDNPSARLFRMEDGQFAPLADGRNADLKLREILASDAPGRGLSKPEHWGLAQVLWAPQGALPIGALSASVSENLRKALGVQLTGEGGSRLEALLEEEFLSLFTKGGKPRTGRDAAPVLAFESELAELDLERQRLVAQHQSFEEASRAVEDARQRRAQARRDADETGALLEKARGQAKVYQDLQAELQQKRQTEQSAWERHETASRTLGLIAKAHEDAARLAAQIQLDEPAVGQLAVDVKSAIERAGELRCRREEARQRRALLAPLASKVEEARAFVADRNARQTLAAKAQRLEELQAALKREKESRSALVAPDDKTIREIRRLAAARDKSEAALQASLIRVTVRPFNAAVVSRPASGEPTPVAAGGEGIFTGSPEVRLEIEGFGSIRASGPATNVEALREEAAGALSKLESLAKPYASPDPDRLQLLRDQAREMDQNIAALEVQARELLGRETPEGLLAQLAELEARIQAQTGGYPAWNEAPPVVSEAQAALEARRREIESAIVEAEDVFEPAQARAQALEKQQAEAVAGLKHARLNLEAAQGRLGDLTQDGVSDPDRHAARQKALMEWESARTQAEGCARRLAEIGEDPGKTVEKLERQFQALGKAEAEARDDESTAKGRLQTLAEAGAYSKLAACDEKRAGLAARIRSEKLRMDALRLLYETVASCKAAAIAAVAAPVERAATRMLARVAGPRLGTLRLTEGFVPAGIQPEIMGAAVEVDNLSGGEQEQLFLVTRLALGQVLAREERQLVVLDDVLNATDTGRLARMLTLLEEAAQRLQIVILTCHPERYRALEGARFF